MYLNFQCYYTYHYRWYWSGWSIALWVLFGVLLVWCVYQAYVDSRRDTYEYASDNRAGYKDSYY